MHHVADGSAAANVLGISGPWIAPHSAGALRLSGSHVHMIGVGGSGMCGAAKLLLHLGARVTGSDQTPFDAMGKLVEQGARISIGHDASLLSEAADLVVMSAAIPVTNPELIRARQRGLKVIKYAELLGLLMRERRGVAIAGTHGKSTTTAMSALVFAESGLKPSFVVGAHSHQLGGSSGVGDGPDFIVESCEFDRSFWHMYPHAAAILNIESDHLDFYKNLDDIVESFAEFAAHTDPDGLLVYNGRDPLARIAARRAQSRTESYAIEDGSSDWQAVNLSCDRGRYRFGVRYGGSNLFSTQLSIPGKHNVENALAAAALAFHAGAAPQRIASALEMFTGVTRRMTWRGEADGVTIVDDYAHHPTEIRVTIEAARRRYEPSRMWVVFQPHQHARTRLLMEDFATAFTGADEIIVPDIYGARESGAISEQNGSEELVTRICRNGGRARYLPALALAAEHVMQHVTPGDLVLTMGAGDIWKVADELVERICGQHAVRRTARAANLVPIGRPGEISVSAA